MAYDVTFFDYVDQGAIRSAEVVVSELFPVLRPTSLLDVGCGRGGWVRTWKRDGCADVCGIDGPHVDQASLYIEATEFVVADLTSKFDLGRRFDLIQCLEVAEHLPASSAAGLIDSIARHGDIVLFSAAVPGQGGTYHINERPIEYWREMFAARGYAAFDYLRPKISQDHRIEPWYRFNSIIYANPAGQARLPNTVLQTTAAAQERLPEFAPWSWHVRRAFIRYLPMPFVNQLARLNAQITRWRTQSG